MSGKRCALLIATETYQDKGIAQLRAPSRDTERLAQVLSDPAIGGFKVDTLIDQPWHTVFERIGDFFHDRERGDLLLLYFSGHGIKDAHGRLYFGMANTRLARLRSTAVAASYVNEQMRDTRSRRKVLILDSCYSGAFARGMTVRSGQQVGVGECFHEGRGHAVLTASDATQYAFEGDTVSGGAEPSVFTQVLVEGLETGKADADQDGHVMFDELYEYVYRGVTERMPAQKPCKWVFEVKGQLYLARNPCPKATRLPAGVDRALRDSQPFVREAAVGQLAKLLRGSHPGHSIAARNALVHLRDDDDSKRVSKAAQEALGEAAGSASGAHPRAPAAAPSSTSPPAARPPAAPAVAPSPPRRPTWAVDAGEDEHGRWADIEVAGVRARLRSVEPGRFVMGSPKGEQGRFDDERPQHEVTLSQGFWLGDTACAQALWEAVMGKNLSRFQSPDRPVENVSWNDVQPFLEKLNSMVPGLAVRLPTEAEWEYACRAGTTTSTYAGELEILGAHNAPLLDDIAWYGGNSCNRFELDNGADSSRWSEKQYPYIRAGTHPVKGKRPNAWGLYDMLGNVWEWCADWYGPYSSAAVSDPSGPAMGSRRVVRGGSWIDRARSVRAASRRAWRGHVPEARHDWLGLRLARGQE